MKYLPSIRNRFERFVLPGLAFKAVVIGGGYATGREIAEFFLPAGPWGGLAALLVATIIWSGTRALTFLFALTVHAQDYRGFFQALLGRGWIAFELAYALFVVLILSIYGAAAGEIGRATFGLPELGGMALLMGGIAAAAAFGNRSVERLFAWVSILLYGVYAIFLVLALSAFGDRITNAFAGSADFSTNWLMGGVTYAGYNIVGAVIILPVVRHLTSRRDAVVAGFVAGPLAMLPAILFFVCMTAFMPDIAHSALPSDLLLTQLSHPAFRLVFQAMIFAALLESGTGAVHAINERIAGVLTARGRTFGPWARAATAGLVLSGCMVGATHFGLVALIAAGYRALALTMIGVFVVPLFTVGVMRLTRHRMPRWEIA